jgi:hypothetical protein
LNGSNLTEEETVEDRGYLSPVNQKLETKKQKREEINILFPERTCSHRSV